jgi:hypothetical protein
MGSLDAGAIQDDQDKVEKTKKKRKLIHGSGPRKRRAEEENPKKLKKSLKEVESQLPEPAQMTMRDIIRRAEAIERKVTAAFFSCQKILSPAISIGL